MRGVHIHPSFYLDTGLRLGSEKNEVFWENCLLKRSLKPDPFPIHRIDVIHRISGVLHPLLSFLEFAESDPDQFRGIGSTSGRSYSMII